MQVQLEAAQVLLQKANRKKTGASWHGDAGGSVKGWSAVGETHTRLHGEGEIEQSNKQETG